MRWNIKHLRQKLPVSCGAVSFAMVANATEAEAVTECNTTTKGTSFCDVSKALSKRNITNYRISYDMPFTAAYPYVKNLSFEYPILVDSEYRSGGIKEKRGRDLVRYHAMLIWQGKIYDPACEQVFPIDCYGHTYNKSLKVRQIIVCGLDNP